jgi:hypothetical protein
MRWPTLGAGAVTIHPWSVYSVGIDLAAVSQTLRVGASAVYPTANLAIYVPFSLGVPITAVQMFIYNGATVSGNVDVGLYAADGTRLVSMGSTAQAGTSVLQAFDITDTPLGPGNYYLACAVDNTTATLFRLAPTARQIAGLGCFTQVTAFPLPAVATFATYASAYLPVFGLSTRTVL